MLVSEIHNARYLGQILEIQVVISDSSAIIHLRIAGSPLPVPLCNTKGALKRFRSLPSLLKIINYIYQQPISPLLEDPLQYPAGLYPFSL